jgi:hypothetical protein
MLRPEDYIWEPNIDPASLAENAALNVFHSESPTERNIEDTERLKFLDRAAEVLDLSHKSYWVEASRAIAMPAEVDFEPDEEVSIIDYGDVTLDGNFLCYARLRIGKIIGPEAVSRISALCLTFHQAIVVPEMQRLPYDMVMYVPVLAVQSIDKS